MLGMCAGLMWKGFETYSQISFRCGPLLLADTCLITAVPRMGTNAALCWAGTSSWLASTGSAPRYLAGTSAASEGPANSFVNALLYCEANRASL